MDRNRRSVNGDFGAVAPLLGAASFSSLGAVSEKLAPSTATASLSIFWLAAKGRMLRNRRSVNGFVTGVTFSVTAPSSPLVATDSKVVTIFQAAGAITLSAKYEPWFVFDRAAQRMAQSP